MARKYEGVINPLLVSKAKLQEIERRIKAGEYANKIARSVGVAANTVRRYARLHGLTIAAAPVKTYRPTNKKARPVMSLAMTTEDYWRGQKSNARWFKDSYR
jgi:hypothetical protein